MLKLSGKCSVETQKRDPKDVNSEAESMFKNTLDQSRALNILKQTDDDGISLSPD